MVGKRVGLLAGLLVLVLGTGVVAREPSPGPVGLGGRVEVPGAGFALAFPDDWAWVRRSGLDAGSLGEMLSNVTDSTYAADLSWLYEAVSEESPVLAMPYVGPQEVPGYCGVEVMAAIVPLDSLVAEHVARLQADDRYPGGATVTVVTLPAGEAVRIDHTFVDPD